MPELELWQVPCKQRAVIIVGRSGSLSKILPLNVASVSSSVLWGTIPDAPFWLCPEISLTRGERKVRCQLCRSWHSSSKLLVFMVPRLFLQQTLSPWSEAQTGSCVAPAWWGLRPELNKAGLHCYRQPFCRPGSHPSTPWRMRAFNFGTC